MSTIKYYKKYAIIIVFFMIHLSESQTYIKNKLINLQQNEKIIYNLSQLYDFSATSIEWPVNIPQSQIIYPFINLSEIKITYTQAYELSSFEDGNAKYILGLKYVQNINGSLDIIIQYIRIKIDPKTNAIKREELQNYKVETYKSGCDDCNFYQYGSMYTSSKGFFSYYLVNNQISLFIRKVYAFEYAQKTGLYLTPIVEGIDLFTNLSILGPNNVVYIIQYRFQQFQLYKYNNQYVDVIDLSPSYENVNINRYFIDSSKYYLAFSLQNSTLYYSTIDYRLQKMIVREIIIPQRFSENNYILVGQRLNDTIIIGISDMIQTTILKIKSMDFLDYGTLSLISTNVIPLILPQQSFMTFINMNSFIYVDGNNIELVDISKSMVTFTQFIDDNLNVLQLDFYGNQIMLFLKKQNQGKISYTQQVVQFAPPCLILLGINQSYIVTVKSNVLPFSLQINLIVNIPQTSLVIIKQPSVLFSKTYAILPNNIQSIPIEQFLTGSDLQLQVNVPETSQNILQNVSFAKFLPLPTDQQEFNDRNFKYFQTDYYFSSLIQRSINGGYQISVLIPDKYEEGKAKLDEIKCDKIFQSEIDQIDNAGSFTLKQDQQTNQKIIQVLFIQQNILTTNIIKIQCDTSNQQFIFASDPFYNIIFVICGETIQYLNYLPAVNNGDLAHIISQQTLTLNASDYNKIICIRGIVYFYSDLKIAGFDYINMAYFPSIITIPTKLNQNQRVYLFKTSFFIFFVSDPITKIAQYAYNNFLETSPVFLRNLQIEENYMVNNSLNIICLRDQTEYLLVESTIQTSYLFYRVSPLSYSQNQLYSVLQLNLKEGDVPVMSSSLYCIISDSINCTEILESASIQYKVSIKEDQFMSNLQFNQKVILLIGDQKQEYNIAINRNGESQFMLVNQFSKTVLDLKDQFLKSNQEQQNTFQFDDQQIVNSCILGWESKKDLKNEIQNRIELNLLPTSPYYLQNTYINNNNSHIINNQNFIELNQQYNQNKQNNNEDIVSANIQNSHNINNLKRVTMEKKQTQNTKNEKFLLDLNESRFTILFNKSVIITKSQVNIMNKLILKENYIGCVALDDQGSFNISEDKSYQIDLYFVCSKNLNKYSLQIKQDETNTILSVVVLNKQQLTTIYIYEANIFSRIITFNQSLVIYSFDQTYYNVVINNSNLSYYFDLSPPTYSSLISFNILYYKCQKIQLTFYKNAIVNLQIIPSSIPNQYLVLQDSLQNFNFSIESNDFINSVEQYSESQFRITFSHSYIYDIQFVVQENNLIAISSAQLYYYKDSFERLLSGIKGSKYTLLFGLQNSEYVITLYNSQNSKQNQSLIESNLVLPFNSSNLGIRYVDENNINEFMIQLSNGQTYQLKIKDNIVLTTNKQRPEFTHKVLQIKPIKQNDPLNIIPLVSKYNPPDPPFITYDIKLQQINLQNIIIFFIIFVL